MKRPWTPGPWDEIYSKIAFTNKKSEANWQLCLKAPDMAELLIELVKNCDQEDVVWNIATKAEKLLKELGYPEGK